MFTPNSDRDRWIIAVVLALALHAGGLLVLYCLPLAAAAPTEAPKPVAVHLVLPPETNDPQFFSELPPNRADARPKKPDFLSNVTSRARDRVPGGADDLPRMEGEGDAPTLKLEPNGSQASARSSPRSELEQTPAKTPKEGLEKQRQAKTGEDPLSALRPVDPEIFGQKNNDDLHKRAASGGSASDINQPEMDKPDANASLIGDVSLNTTAWDYAPWVMDFERKVMRGWFAPPAYSYGILKEGGWGLFQLEVSRSGKEISLELLGEQGHPALIRTAQSALRNASPLDPLPSDFPESTLIVRVRMTYPRIPSR